MDGPLSLSVSVSPTDLRGRVRSRRADVEMREADEGEGESHMDEAEDEEEERAVDNGRRDGLPEADSKRSVMNTEAISKSHSSKKCTFCNLIFISEEK